MIVKTDCVQHYSRYIWPHLQGGVLQQDVLPVSRQREGGGAVVSLESYVLVNVTEYEYSQIGTIRFLICSRISVKVRNLQLS